MTTAKYFYCEVESEQVAHVTVSFLFRLSNAISDSNRGDPSCPLHWLQEESYLKDLRHRG